MPLKRHIHKGLYGAFIIDPDPARYSGEEAVAARARNHTTEESRAVNEMVMVLNGFDTNFDGENEVYAANTVAFAYDMSRPIPITRGQRQRLSIARALAIHPRLLLFDDSFSALDFKTDRALRQALADEVTGATILIVAQRINTIRHADQILVLEEGSIVGRGTHDQLMESCPVYQEIAMSQLKEEESSAIKGGELQ